MKINRMYNKIAKKVCNKDRNLSSNECFKINGKINSLCSDYGKCRIFEKSEEQLKYVLSSIKESVFLEACPGSGKTEVVGLKTAYEMQKWDKDYGQGIAILTFTNNAASVISERVCQFSNIDNIAYPHFIGTIDSWLQGYIAQPFLWKSIEEDGCVLNEDYKIRIIDNNFSSPFLNAFKTKYQYNKTGNVQANQYYYDIESDSYKFSSNNKALDTKRNSIILEKYQKDDLNKIKWKFWQNYFATYQDIEYFSHLIIEKTENFTNLFSQRFPLIIVDECQDLSWIQMKILNMLKQAGSNLHFVGDLNQAIYGFKEVAPEKVLFYINNNDFQKMNLSKNFRSTQKIVDICQNIINGLNDISGENKLKNFQPLLVCYDKDNLDNLVKWFENKLIENEISQEKSVILARGWSLVNKIRPSKNNTIKNDVLRLSASIYLWKKGGCQTLEEALKYLGQFMLNKFFKKNSGASNIFYCPDCIESPLLWRLFLADILNNILNSSINDLTVSWKDWAKIVRDNFSELCRDLFENFDFSKDIIMNADTFKFSALSGKSDKVVDRTLGMKVIKATNIRTTVFHQVKGETLDAVLVVSSPTKQGETGHWSHWLNNSSSEAARLAYVASSRPKDLLVWAIEKKDKDNRQAIVDLGFEYLEIDENDIMNL